jgi:hypothetical protein
MHRYRDALVYNDKLNGISGHSRPVYGAFALYTGYYPQSAFNMDRNPYQRAIEEIGIGAFPLVPGQVADIGGAGNAWLRTFLGEKLGAHLYSGKANADHLYIQESARIPATGMFRPDTRISQWLLLGHQKTAVHKTIYNDSVTEVHAGITCVCMLLKETAFRRI